MPPIRLKALMPILAFFIVTLFFWGVDRYKNEPVGRFAHPIERLSHTSSSPSQVTIQSKTPDQLCDPDVSIPPPLSFSEWLVRKNYTRAYFRPHHVASNAPFESLENIDQHVLQPFRPLDRGMRVSNVDNTNDPWPCPSVIDVDVAADTDVDDSQQFLFGLATTVERLDRLLPSLLYSYGNTKASLLVLVPEDTPNIPAQEIYFRDRGLDVTIKTSPLDHTARYFGLVEAFTEHIKENRPNTTWVSFVDDDTFFPALGSLTTRVASLDPSKKHYIGSLSEASWQVDTFGYIGFGGAGVFISLPLLEELHKNYEECQGLGDRPGDQKLAMCVEKCGTQLTLWPSLYQMDMNGAPDGVFESGRQIDSLHHWTSWYEKDVVKMSTVAAAAGRRSVLRRWRFDELTTIDNKTGATKRSFWVLTNGYSLVKYTMNAKLPADSVKFDRTEKTWDEDERGYEKRLGPLRPKNQPGIKKERWMLQDAVILGDNVHQIYSREDDETHSVIELVWLGPAGGGGAGVGGMPTTPTT